MKNGKNLERWNPVPHDVNGGCECDDMEEAPDGEFVEISDYNAIYNRALGDAMEEILELLSDHVTSNIATPSYALGVALGRIAELKRTDHEEGE